jgi:hypothetical protein
MVIKDKVHQNIYLIFLNRWFIKNKRVQKTPHKINVLKIALKIQNNLNVRCHVTKILHKKSVKLVKLVLKILNKISVYKHVKMTLLKLVVYSVVQKDLIKLSVHALIILIKINVNAQKEL